VTSSSKNKKKDDEKPKTLAEPEFGELTALIRKHRLPIDADLLEKAFLFSKEAHKHQKRRSGEPYIHHPFQVAKLLIDLRLDTASVITGILHDTVEDTGVTLEQVEKEFGQEVALLVDGVTKIGQMTFQTSEEKQADNFRKMILAMAKDLRVILVKLADRLHNMRTLQHLPAEKQVKIAQETLDIYSPLANRLGLQSFKRELEDLSLRYSKPEIYYRLVSLVAKKRLEREKYINHVRQIMMKAFREHGYATADVSGRPKHFYSIHKKMERRKLAFEQVFDIIGFRIHVESVEQCYGILGLVHSLWTPLPGRFKDYIAIPKANFYQSLHTTVVGPDGEHIEVQIRTHKMHETAEWGIAAHWSYKEGALSIKDKEHFAWLNRLLEWNRDLSDPSEFLETVKLDLFSEEVYVFTPNGEIKAFPQGATPLDFAYSVHSDVGNHCSGVKINGRIVPLRHKLKSGDTIEVLTSPNQQPNKDWLNIVKTSRAKSKIRQFIKVQEHEKSLSMGQVILERELKREGLKLNKIVKDGSLSTVAQSFNIKSIDDLISEIGYGKISVFKVINKLLPKESEKKEETSGLQKIFETAKEKKAEGPMVIKVKGVEDLLVRVARCCNPVPGDSVIGFITRGRGISVHLKKCSKILGTDPHRLIDIEWDLSQKVERSVKVRVVSDDRPGMLADMSKIIRDQDANITRAQIRTTKDHIAVCLFSVAVRDLKHLKRIISKLEGISGIISVERVQKLEG